MFANAVEVVSKSVLIRPIQFFSGSYLPNFEKSSQSADSPLCISDQPDDKKNNNSLETETTISCCLLPGVVWPRFQEEVACRQKVGVSKTSNQNLNFYPRSQHNCLTVAKHWEKTRAAPLEISWAVNCTALNFLISSWISLLLNNHVHVHCEYNTF